MGGEPVGVGRGEVGAPARALAPTTAILTGAMGLAAFPIFSLAALSPLVVGELAITRTELGAVSTTMFTTAMAGSVLMGRFVDLLGARRVLVGLLMCSTLAIALLASAGSFAWLLATGVVVGLAQAAANPATNAVIAARVPAPARGTLTGIKQSGVPLAQFVAGVGLAPLAVYLGWRGSVLLGLVLIVPTLIATLVILPSGTGSVGRHARAGLGVPRTLTWLFLATFLLAMTLQAVNVYLPLYAFEVVGTSAATAGVLVGVVGVVGVVARVLHGRFSGRSSRPVRVVALIAIAATLSAGVLGAAGIGDGSLTLLWIGGLGFGASVFGVNVVSMTVIIRTVTTSNVGRASGALATSMFLGFALGPLGFGALVDATSSYLLGWSVVTALGVVTTAVCLAVWWRAAWREGPA